MVDYNSMKVIEAPAASLKSMYRSFKDAPVAETKQMGELFLYYTRVAHPWFRGALIGRAPKSDETEFLRSIKDFFSTRKVDSFSVWLEQDASVEDWSQHFEHSGYKFTSGPPGMAADLAELPDSVVTPDNFRIRRVENLDDLHAWTQVFCAGYGLGDEIIEPYYELNTNLGVDQLFHFYSGYLKGKLVCTSMVIYSEDDAGIYCVATLDEARGQGLGAAITLRPLLEAREKGYSLGVLQSSDMGFRIYQRLGFRKVSNVGYFYYSAS